MDDKTVNAIILIRNNKDIPTEITDDEIVKLIAIGDRLRADMRPEIEVEYDETQQRAIICSTVYEIANDGDLDNFDFEKFDAEFDKTFA